MNWERDVRPIRAAPSSATDEMTGDRFQATLLDSWPDGFLLADKKGALVQANQTVAAMFGYDVDELLRLSVDDLVPVEQRSRHRQVREYYSDAPTRRPMGSGLRLLGQHADGSLFPVEVSLSPVEIDGQMHTIAAVRDVSQRQAAAAELALLRDRERIARDIHDMVIQRLFGAGLGLQAVLGSVQSTIVAERVSHVIDELDETIRQLRTAIFQLTVNSADTTLTDQVYQVVHERSKMLAAEAEVVVASDIDEVPERIGEHLVATIGEALANVARHAQASSCRVEVSISDSQLRLKVCDDGIGLPAEIERRGGLANMRERAVMLGGCCDVATIESGGTCVAWSVPV